MTRNAGRPLLVEGSNKVAILRSEMLAISERAMAIVSMAMATDSP